MMDIELALITSYREEITMMVVFVLSLENEKLRVSYGKM